jgi:hypothetical protein
MKGAEGILIRRFIELYARRRLYACGRLYARGAILGRVYPCHCNYWVDAHLPRSIFDRFRLTRGSLGPLASLPLLLRFRLGVGLDGVGRRVLFLGTSRESPNQREEAYEH